MSPRAAGDVRQPFQLLGSRPASAASPSSDLRQMRGKRHSQGATSPNDFGIQLFVPDCQPPEAAPPCVETSPSQVRTAHIYCV